MRRIAGIVAALTLALALPFLPACSDDEEGHDVSMGGAGHRPGFGDPLANCTSCHGATLGGGKGPSCYACHTNADHTEIRGGQSHRAGDAATCTDCHGPSNTGGLGPACASCHV